MASTHEVTVINGEAPVTRPTLGANPMLDQIMDVAKVFVASEFFADSVKLSQAAVKIMAGQEFGFGPFASMNGIYIVKGKVTLSSNLMATAIKRSGKYNYRVREHTAEGCEIEFFESGQPIGRSKFTIQDAKRQGTQNTEKFPKNMLFARALSNGAKWFCPDAFGGAAVYAPEDFGLQQSADGTYQEPEAAAPVVEERPHFAEPKRKSETQKKTCATHGDFEEMFCPKCMEGDRS